MLENIGKESCGSEVLPIRKPHSLKTFTLAAGPPPNSLTKKKALQLYQPLPRHSSITLTTSIIVGRVHHKKKYYKTK